MQNQKSVLMAIGGAICGLLVLTVVLLSARLSAIGSGIESLNNRIAQLESRVSSANSQIAYIQSQISNMAAEQQESLKNHYGFEHLFKGYDSETDTAAVQISFALKEVEANGQVSVSARKQGGDDAPLLADAVYSNGLYSAQFDVEIDAAYSYAWIIAAPDGGQTSAPMETLNVYQRLNNRFAKYNVFVEFAMDKQDATLDILLQNNFQTNPLLKLKRVSVIVFNIQSNQVVKTQEYTTGFELADGWETLDVKGLTVPGYERENLVKIEIEDNAGIVYTIQYF